MANPIEPGPAPILDAELLQPFCKRTRFESGDPLRQKGQHYRDMFLVTDGLVEVDLQSGSGVGKLVVSGAGTPIGEIGFLRGCQRHRDGHREDRGQRPGHRRRCPRAPRTRAADTRLAAPASPRRDGRGADQLQSHAHLDRRHLLSARKRSTCSYCRNSDMLESAKRLRYEVYCEELGRNSPYADHDKQDDLRRSRPLRQHFHRHRSRRDDRHAAQQSLPAEGSLGHLEDLYGMRRSAHHPSADRDLHQVHRQEAEARQPGGDQADLRDGRLRPPQQYQGMFHRLRPGAYAVLPGDRVSRSPGPSSSTARTDPPIPMRLDLAKHGETARPRERRARISEDVSSRPRRSGWPIASAATAGHPHPGVHPAK